MSAVLNIVECRGCGAAFWEEVEKPITIAGGPCCFGHEVLDIERYPTAQAAAQAWPALESRRKKIYAELARKIRAEREVA